MIDQDSSAEKCIQTEFAKLRLKCPDIYTDPGHSKKSLEKALVKIFQTSAKYDGIAGRISRWYIRLIKRCEIEAKANNTFNIDYMSVLFSRYWSHTARHYSVCPCHSRCPCKSMDMNEKPADTDDASNE